MTTAGAWEPPHPTIAPTAPPLMAAFAFGYTYGHLVHLRLPSFENRFQRVRTRANACTRVQMRASAFLDQFCTDAAVDLNLTELSGPHWHRCCIQTHGKSRPMEFGLQSLHSRGTYAESIKVHIDVGRRRRSGSPTPTFIDLKQNSTTYINLRRLARPALRPDPALVPVSLRAEHPEFARFADASVPASQPLADMEDPLAGYPETGGPISALQSGKGKDYEEPYKPPQAGRGQNAAQCSSYQAFNCTQLHSPASASTHLHGGTRAASASSKSTAAYTNRSPSEDAPTFIVHDQAMISDLGRWFECMISSAAPNGAPYRSLLTPPACAHCWDVIETHAMGACENEGWVEAYATNVISLVSCLIQGVWPNRRLAEWGVTLSHSQQGDRHLTFAERVQLPGGRLGLKARSATAGEWKTETVFEHQVAPMVADCVLPPGKATNGDAILKKLGLHVVSTNAQCQRHNHSLPRPQNIPATVVNAHYGIIFTGQSCLSATLTRFPPVYGPTPPNQAPFTGLAIDSASITTGPHSVSLISLVLGMIWAQENILVKRNLRGTQGHVDRMYNPYLAKFWELVQEVLLVRLGQEVREVRQVEGVADFLRATLAHSFPQAAEVEGQEERGPQTRRATANISPLVAGMLFNINSKCLAGHIVLSFFFVSPKVPDALDLKIIKSVLIVGSLGASTRAKILRRAHLARRSCGGAAAVTRRFNFFNSADRVLEWRYPHQNSEGCTHRLVVCNGH
ncbi:hypothetical protein C8F04DRAFT_1177123 [Mycena alexandri]|uniref:Uncharacterized protein n=1 Tax=Mycena alexandri TaxID=1745969 RepID=A0AAD6T8V8_9AGAR|nr:hypothetical protein C8F04DRAFT_1177123 [Mycena alexandri]